MDGEPNGIVIVTSEKELPGDLLEGWQWLMKDYSVEEVFGGSRDGMGHRNYTHRVPSRRLGLCAEAVVFKLFEMEEPVEISWSENFFSL